MIYSVFIIEDYKTFLVATCDSEEQAKSIIQDIKNRNMLLNECYYIATELNEVNVIKECQLNSNYDLEDKDEDYCELQEYDCSKCKYERWYGDDDFII